MIFKWNNDSIEDVHIDMGRIICGMSRKNTRPDEVLFTEADVKELIVKMQKSPQETLDYIFGSVLKTTYKPNGT